MARAGGAAASPEAPEAAAAGAGLPAVPAAQPEGGRGAAAAELQTLGEPRAGEGQAGTAAGDGRCQGATRSESQPGESRTGKVGRASRPRPRL